MLANDVSPAYFLSPHVFCSHTGRYSVFLDLRRDLYLSVRQDALAQAIQWSNDSAAYLAGPSLDQTPQPDLINQLVKQQLVTTNSRTGKPIFPAATTSEPAPCPVYHCPTPASPFHTIAFIYSMVRAGLDLRYCRLGTIVQRLGSRKSGHQIARRGDVRRVHELVYVFNYLRPFYPRQAVCLYDSLALLHFLGAFHVNATLIVGVRADPFAAHCWVRCADFVLNETPEEASRYTPILTV